MAKMETFYSTYEQTIKGYCSSKQK